MRWLLPPVTGFPISQRYGEHKERYAKMGLPMGHEGIDWATPNGTPVLAAADGQIVSIHRVPAGHPYGVYLRLAHTYNGEAWITVYAHLSKLADGLTIGHEVKRGQIVGWSGNTGNSTGPHLHFSVRRSGKIVDPEPYLLQEAA